MPTIKTDSGFEATLTGAEVIDILLDWAVANGGVLPDGGETEDVVSVRFSQAGINEQAVAVNAVYKIALRDVEGDGTTPV